MRRSTLALLLAVISFAVTAVSAIVYARDPEGSSGSMMGGGMMGGGMMDGGMMGGGMMGRMMSGMMGNADAMMHRSSRGGRPNEQWRNDGRSMPDRGE